MDILRQPVIWAVSVPLVVLYVLTAFFLFLVLYANQRVVEAPKGGKPLSPAAVAAMAFASNFLAVATVAILARAGGYPARLSIVLLPLGLVVEHYGRALYRERRRRAVHAAGLAGSAAGMLAGAFTTIRSVAETADTSRLVLPADVETLPITDVLRRGDDWAVSLQLLVGYLVSIALFFTLHQFLVRFGKKALARAHERGGKGLEGLLPLAGACLAGNAAATALVVAVCAAAGVAPRLAMVLVSMFLVAESYTKSLVNDRTGRYAYLVGVLSSSAGMIVGMLLLMRGARLQ